jgi:hypothetical protein
MYCDKYKSIEKLKKHQDAYVGHNKREFKF